MAKERVLIGSPVHQQPDILQEFLKSLTELEKKIITVDYFFADVNELGSLASYCLIFRISINKLP